MLSYIKQKERSRIGSVLVKKGLINPNQLDYAIRLQAETSEPLGQILIDRSFITEAELNTALIKQSRLRIFAIIITFTLMPFQLSHAAPSPAKKPNELSDKLQLAMTEDMEGVETSYPSLGLTNVNQQQSALERKLSLIWDNYDELLSRHVSKGQKERLEANMVDYGQLRHDSAFNELVDSLKKFPIHNIKSNKQQIAFYLNTYNILAMKMVADHWPIRKLSSLGGIIEPVWDKPAGVAAGKEVTLGEVEHDILRKLGEPRVHFAMNCASMSCPDLRKEAYRAEILDQQLDQQVDIFLNQNLKGGYLKANTFFVSKIFKWFSADFKPEGGVDAFIRKYRPDLPEETLISPSLSYNWAVNCHLTTADRRALH